MDDLTVFMFHRVLPFEHPEAVTTELFQQQLAFLEKRYTFLTPEEAYEYILDGTCGRKDRHFAMLSFDDGWLDNLLYAQPILLKRRLKAALAVSLGTLKPGEVRRTAGKDFLSVGMDQARADFAAGKPGPFLNEAELKWMAESDAWSLELHGTVHQRVNGVSRLARPMPDESPADFEAFLKQDLLACADAVERIAGRRPQAMFWPWGHYSAASVRVADELGFRIQFTVKKGVVHAGTSAKILPRIGVSSNMNKLKKNVRVFRNPLFTAVHDCFHTERVCFDD